VACHGIELCLQERSLSGGRRIWPDGFSPPFLYWNGSGEYNYVEAIKKMGYAIWYEPKMAADHLIPRGRLEPDFFLARSHYYGIGDSFDLVAAGNAPVFSVAAAKAFSRYLYAAVRQLAKLRLFEARRKGTQLKRFAIHQFVCLFNAELVECCRRIEWITFDFSKVSAFGSSKSKSQW
jgi:hypothetical protein